MRSYHTGLEIKMDARPQGDPSSLAAKLRSGRAAEEGLGEGG